MHKSLLAVLCLALGPLAACRQEQASAPPAAAAPVPAQSCALDVGWDPWEPYQYEDADGTVRGLDIEIIALLAARAGCSVAYHRGNWLDLLKGLRQGEIDLLLAASETEDRRTFAWFTRPYRQESFAVFVRKEQMDALSGKDLAALVADGRRIGITEGYYYGVEVSELIGSEPSAKAFVAVPVVEMNYARLADGAIDALLDDPFVASSVLRRKGLGDAIVRLPDAIASGEVSLMLSRKSVDETTVRKLDAALAQARQDGSLETLLSKYRG